MSTVLDPLPKVWSISRWYTQESHHFSLCPGVSLEMVHYPHRLVT